MIDGHSDVDGLVRMNPDDDRGLGGARSTKLGHVSDSPIGYDDTDGVAVILQLAAPARAVAPVVKLKQEFY